MRIQFGAGGNANADGRAIHLHEEKYWVVWMWLGVRVEYAEGCGWEEAEEVGVRYVRDRQD
jgi:hypothetical protein